MKKLSYVVVFLIGALVSSALSLFGLDFKNILMVNNDHLSSAPVAIDEPLYWVAPMDPNYRRDNPGKSPMGMDLVAVYAESENSNNNNEIGTIAVSPEVVSTLGVRTGLVFSDVLKPEIRTVGYLGYNQEKLIHVHPRVEGWVEQTFVKSNGEEVEKGSPLFDLYSPVLVNAQEEFLFSLSQRDNRMIQAAEERLRSLNVPSQFISNLKANKRVSQTVRFYAEEAGVVENLSISDGIFIQPGMTLMSITDLSEIWLEAEVFERQSHLVKVGQPVEASMDFLPGKTFISTVDFIYPSLDAKNRSLRVRIKLENPDKTLRPDMFASVVIDASETLKRVLIPKDALIRGGKQNRVVLAIGEGRYKSIEVQVGLQGNDFVEILEGLTVGDEIVTSGQFLLDSESSKTSDFRRMNYDDVTMNNSDLATTSVSSDAVWVSAAINSLNAEARTINIDHSPIAEWNWPAMTMSFNVAEWVDMSELVAGDTMQFEIIKEANNQYVVSDYFNSPGTPEETL